MIKRLSKFFSLCALFFSFLISSCSGGSSNPIKVTSISFSLSSTSIEEGQLCLINNLEVLPENATNKKVQFWSENIEVASVNSDSLTVGAIKPGVTKICAKALDGSEVKFDTELTVTAKAIYVSEIQLAVDPSTFYVGDKFTPTVNVMPSNADNQQYDIISSNDNVSINNATKEITCNVAGKTTLYAIAKDGSQVTSNVVEITIKNVPTSAIKLSADKTKIEVRDTVQLNVTYTPVDAFDRKVNYTVKSGYSSYLKVSSSGLVTGLAIGTGYVVATLASNPSISDEIAITVTDIQPTSVSISLPDTVYKGDVYQATATVLPVDAFTTTPVFSIASGNAAITESGQLVVLGAGDVKVHVYLKEKTDIMNDLTIHALDEEDPYDPYGPDDDF
ncbi:MAG: Ig-like domain-containing protein [Bacilli bacterium]|nr:Ig-like domain-containing protein [Bacilli bacterium]